jgi:hypothetical protein
MSIHHDFWKRGVMTVLPDALLQALQDHLRRVREQHETDLSYQTEAIPTIE